MIDNWSNSFTVSFLLTTVSSISLERGIKITWKANMNITIYPDYWEKLALRRTEWRIHEDYVCTSFERECIHHSNLTNQLKIKYLWYCWECGWRCQTCGTILLSTFVCVNHEKSHKRWYMIKEHTVWLAQGVIKLVSQFQVSRNIWGSTGNKFQR